MCNKLGLNCEIFKDERFGEIRVAGTSEQPLFCLADICRVLEIKNVSDCKSKLKQDGVVLTEGVSKTTNQYGVTTEQKVMLTFISEQNLYKVIMRSDKPQAEPFQDWVCGEVLPSIRKTGSYSIMNKVPHTFAEALRLAAEQQEKIEAQQKLIEVQKPKVEFYDDVVESKDAMSMDRVAKTINMGIGRNKLFELLRKNKILMPNNTPYQRFVDAGWFRCIETKFTKPNGDICINVKTVVLQKGVDAIRRIVKNICCKVR